MHCFEFFSRLQLSFVGGGEYNSYIQILTLESRLASAILPTVTGAENGHTDEPARKGSGGGVQNEAIAVVANSQEKSVSCETKGLRYMRNACGMRTKGGCLKRRGCVSKMNDDV